MSHVVDEQQDAARCILASNVSMCRHVFLICVCGVLLFGVDIAWLMAAGVAVALGLASRCDPSGRFRTVAWVVVLACHGAVVAGVIGVLTATTSVWRALAATAVLLLLIHMQQQYGDCILTCVERAFKPGCTIVDGVGMAFMASEYDSSDVRSTAHVTAGIMACAMCFAVAKIIVLS